MWKEIGTMFGTGPGREPVPIGYRQDVKKGTAYIRSCISGKPEDYEIEIQKVDYSTSHKNKKSSYQSDRSQAAGADWRHRPGK